MTTTSVTGISSIATGTDAWFRTLKVFSDMLTTLGFPKTSDTGQIDWTTVTVKSSDTYADYEIRRFNDATQGADPVFMKIGYGRVVVSGASHPTITIEIGTGSNGSGTLTGSSGLARKHMLQTLTTGATDWIGSSDGSGFAMILGASQNVRCTLVVERARKADGDPMTGHLLAWKNCPATTVAGNILDVSFAHFDLAAATYDTVTGAPVTYLTGCQSDTSVSASQNVLLSGKYPFGVMGWPTSAGKAFGKLLVGYSYIDFLHGIEVDVTRFSDNEVVHYRVYKPFNIAGFFGPFEGSAGLASSNVFRYAMPAIYWM